MQLPLNWICISNTVRDAVDTGKFSRARQERAARFNRPVWPGSSDKP